VDALTHSGFLAHTLLPGYKRRVEQAQRCIAIAFETIEKPYIALSGGKDSTVVFDLARAIRPDIMAVWSDDEFYLPETKHYIDLLIKSGMNVHHIRTNAKHRDWFVVSGDWNGIDDYTRQLEYNGVFIGLRKAENNYRKVHLNTYGTLFFSKKDQMWHCNPIADFSAMDVWAYIVSNDILYNRAYDKLMAMGLSLKYQRIGPFATERATEMGALAILRQGWPEEYQRFVNEHPEGRRFA